MDRILARFTAAEALREILERGELPRSGRPPRALFSQPLVLATPADDATRRRLAAAGATVFEDVRFDIMPGWDDDDDDGDDDHSSGWMQPPVPDLADAYTLDDVVAQVRAPEAWTLARGKGVTIAVVDTGVSGEAPHIPEERRSRLDLRSFYEGQHWLDPRSHGTMCAAIAAGSKDAGSRYDGVAPEATVLAARCTLGSTDLAEVYDELIRARVEQRLTGPLVISNSYGKKTCSPPDVLPANHPYLTQVLLTIDQGAFVCFAAGNLHSGMLCKHNPKACGPNTIWGPNSHDRVVCVGTVDRDLTNCNPDLPHANSSRGPGQWAEKTVKPDCVAPTYGAVPWGTGYRRMRWWGTSGACPQVAGAAALVLSVAPHLEPADVAEILTDTCYLLPEGRTCVGHGLLDCASAVEAAHARRKPGVTS